VQCVLLCLFTVVNRRVSSYAKYLRAFEIGKVLIKKMRTFFKMIIKNVLKNVIVNSVVFLF
jgi:hypothetical protein